MEQVAAAPHGAQGRIKTKAAPTNTLRTKLPQVGYHSTDAADHPEVIGSGYGLVVRIVGIGLQTDGFAPAVALKGRRTRSDRKNVKMVLFQAIVGAIDEDHSAIGRQPVHRITFHPEGNPFSLGQIHRDDVLFNVDVGDAILIGQLAGLDPREQGYPLKGRTARVRLAIIRRPWRGQAEQAFRQRASAASARL